MPNATVLTLVNAEWLSDLHLLYDFARGVLT